MDWGEIIQGKWGNALTLCLIFSQGRICWSLVTYIPACCQPSSVYKVTLFIYYMNIYIWCLQSRKTKKVWFLTKESSVFPCRICSPWGRKYSASFGWGTEICHIWRKNNRHNLLAPSQILFRDLSYMSPKCHGCQLRPWSLNICSHTFSFILSAGKDTLSCPWLYCFYSSIWFIWNIWCRSVWLLGLITVQLTGLRGPGYASANPLKGIHRDWVSEGKGVPTLKANSFNNSQTKLPVKESLMLLDIYFNQTCWKSPILQFIFPLYVTEPQTKHVFSVTQTEVFLTQKLYWGFLPKNLLSSACTTRICKPFLKYKAEKLRKF